MDKVTLDYTEADTPEKREKILKFEPMHHFVHIEKLLLKELRTTGGIILPQNIDEKAAVFRVLAVGPGYADPLTGKRMAMLVAVGDLVLVNVHEVVNIAYCGQGVLIVPETGILGKVDFLKKDLQ